MVTPGCTAAYWAGEAGPRWVRDRDLHDRQLAPFLDALLQAAEPKPGERVLDVGCGAGTSTLEVARLVAPNGTVVGVDVSPDLVAELRRRAAAAAEQTPELDIETLLADAQDAALPGPFDLLVSRMGVMFFDDPVAAWSNLHRSMASGGRAAVVVWQEQSANPWMSLPAQSALEVSPPVEPPPGPGEPGAHALADPDLTRRRLTDAGWHDIAFDEVRTLVQIGADLDDAVEHARALASVTAAIERVGAEPVLAAVRAALEPLVADDGAVRLEAAVWVVTARA